MNTVITKKMMLEHDSRPAHGSGVHVESPKIMIDGGADENFSSPSNRGCSVDYGKTPEGCFRIEAVKTPSKDVDRHNKFYGGQYVEETQGDWNYGEAFGGNGVLLGPGLPPNAPVEQVMDRLYHRDSDDWLACWIRSQMLDPDHPTLDDLCRIKDSMLNSAGGYLVTMTLLLTLAHTALNVPLGEGGDLGVVGADGETTPIPYWAKVVYLSIWAVSAGANFIGVYIGGIEYQDINNCPPKFILQCVKEHWDGNNSKLEADTSCLDLFARVKAFNAIAAFGLSQQATALGLIFGIYIIHTEDNAYIVPVIILCCCWVHVFLISIREFPTWTWGWPCISPMGIMRFLCNPCKNWQEMCCYVNVYV